MRSLRQSLDYLHTWAGVLFAGLLFLVFFMGSLSVFDREIDRWMMPDTRLAPVAQSSIDQLALPHLAALAPDATLWIVQPAWKREPFMRIRWSGGQKNGERLVDVASGRLLPKARSKGGSGFFFPFHYSFHLKWMNLGYWLLALVSTVMLAMLVSGTIMHKKIFTELFTFRPRKSVQRATLDLHALSAVLLLPFHFLITWSGLIIFVFIFMQPALELAYGDDAPAISEQALPSLKRSAAGQAAPLAPIDAMVVQAQAQAEWGGGAVRRILIHHPGDAHALVQLQRRPDDTISYQSFPVTFDGVSGQLLHSQQLSATLKLQRFISGLHMIPADHWAQRWIYFVMGLVSCVMIATGLLAWVEKRRVRQQKEGRISYRLVNALAVAATLGVLLATLAMMVANQALPAHLPGRALMEQLTFFAVWIGALGHALLRALDRRRGAEIRLAWREQAQVSALLALAAVVLNGFMTGDHLAAALGQGMLAVAGTDLALLVTAALALVCARRLSPGRASTAAVHPLQRQTQ
jgi:uncharacterized iron-regulated membrane protein